MPDSDLMFRSASELAGMVRAGEVSSRELVEISLARIEELNPQLNAFVEVDAERALAAADEIQPGDERPFAGVPIAIKNNRAVSGLRLTDGCSLMQEFVADYDHNVTRRLRDAGFVIVGTTTLPEYGILPTTEAQHLRSHAQSVGPRAHARRLLRWLGRRGRQRAWCRSLTATTAAARSASPPRAAAWWGSSPVADASPPRPSSASRRS